AVTIPNGAREVDATGQYVIPGLIDAHVHALLPVSFPELFVVNGVTTVRDLGNRIDVVKAVNARVRSGALLGPELVYTGPQLDAIPRGWPGYTRGVGLPSRVPALVAELKAAGATAVKVYERLNPEVYDAIVAEAKK